MPARFVFIIGASGSGTTMLSRVLSGPRRRVSLGGNYIALAPPNEPADAAARALVDRFNVLTQDLWDRHADTATHDAARTAIPEVYRELLALPEMRDVSHVVYKRSAPFMLGDRYRPDLSDLFPLFDDVRIIAAYRDPRASAASSFRRGFAPSLRQCAVITEEQLTYINAQLATLESSRVLVLPYERFCEHPAAWTNALATLTGIDHSALQNSIAAEKIDPRRNDRWRQELEADDAAMLNRFFDDRRRAQWPLLDAAARA